MRRVGLAGGVVLTSYLCLVVFALVTETRVPLTPWPAAKPSPSGRGSVQDALLPRGAARRPLPAHAPAPGSAPTTGRSPARASAPAPTGRTSPATTATTASVTPTGTPGKGHGYGRTKKPRSKRT
jgi:hypothetical protein